MGTHLTDQQRDRYARHLLLPGVGEEGQKRLLDGRVAVVGAGGLGTPALLYLAAAGVGTLGIFDFDTVDRSNLQRQVLYTEADVGRPKVEAARERLRALNPDVRIETHPAGLTRANALEALAAYDVWIDGTDVLEARYLLSDAAEILGRPVVHGAVRRFEGQVTVFHHEGGPGYRDLFPDARNAASCADVGVLGVLPGWVGTLQATEALKLLLGLGEVLSGRLLLLNALTMETTTVTFARDPRRTPVEVLAGPKPTEDGETMSFERIGVVAAKKRMDEGWEPFVLDVRRPDELEVSRFGFMDLNHPHTRVAEVVDQLPKDRDILVTCRSGGRSAAAAAMLSSHGFSRLFNLEGGINDWAVKVDTSMTVY